ncbi:MAG: cytochrome ubiquinol oxidase subunit I [Candidatus Micrarchaeaceae archaeon]
MLSPVIFDRFDMGFSLAVHILLVLIGMTLPIMILLAEVIGTKFKDRYYLTLARRLTLAFVVFFGIGTASGTLVAANLLFLWPKFMALVGQVAILPVYAEVFAFFIEAIFVGIYFYSGNKLKGKYSHAALMVFISIGAALSAVFITMLNAFMNTPVGFNIKAYLANGVITGVQPLSVFNTPSTWVEVFHVLATSYFGGIFILVAYFAYRLINADARNEEVRIYYRKALSLSLVVALLATLAAIGTGLVSISSLYYVQPEKYAAIELDLTPMSHAPELIGGIYSNGRVIDSISIPNLQSILATGSANGSVPGLSEFPRDTWPPLFVHIMFDAMVFLGFAMGGFFVLLLLLKLLGVDLLRSKKVMYLYILAAVVAVALVENGWVMSEIGRQPWIIYGVMTVSQAANYSQATIPIAIAVVLFYIFIFPATVEILKIIFSKRQLEDDLGIK